MMKFRLTHPQKRIIDVEMMANRTSVNNIPIYIAFPKDEEQLLKKALTKVLSEVKGIHLQLTTTPGGEFETYFRTDDVKNKEEEIQIVNLKGSSKESWTAHVDEFLLKSFGDILDKRLYDARIVLTDVYTILCLRFHHLVCDGTSLAIIREHIINTYESMKIGKDYQIPHNDYFKYLRIEDEYDKSIECGRDKSYWLSHLNDLSGSPNGIADLGEFNAKTIAIELSNKTITNLKNYNYSFNKPISPFVFTLGLLNIFIGRYYQAESVLLTTGFHNRLYDEEVNNSVGMLVSTVPLKMRYDSNLKITEVMEKAKSELKQSLTHSRYPYDTLLEDLTSLGVDIKKLLNFSIVSNSIQENDQYPTSHTKLNASYSPFLLRVNYGKDDKLGLQSLLLEFRKDCFDEQEMQSIANCFKAMIEDIASNPYQTCGKVRLLSEDEESRIINEFNNTKFESKYQVETILDMFKDQVVSSPDKTAVVYEERQYSYKQLDEITDNLAKHLKSMGVKTEDTVAVLIDRSEYMVIYPLAILKAGAGYMPLDYTFPTDRLEYMLDDAGVRIILSEGDKPEEFIPGFTGDVIKREDIINLHHHHDIELTPPRGDNKFVVLYTSGSTGKPKGCVLEHHNLVNFCQWYIDYYSVTDQDKGAAYANFAFDAHMFDIYPFITGGATVYIIPSSMRLDFLSLNEYYEKMQISLTFLTTLLGKQFVETFDNKYLRMLTVGGEKLPSMKLPKYTVVNGYGPTECTIVATTHKIQHEDDCLNIGKPLHNCHCYIVDNNLQLLPIGVVGELCIGGAGVGRGYLNRPELTTEKFIMWRGERVYRTGDHVKWLANGEIEFVGRIDGQIKLRGLRIELGEVENKINQYEGITACAATVKEIGGTQHLCAYYVSNKDIDIEDLKESLAVDLTSFMIPDVFTRLEKLPFTSNGKVNKKLLPEPVIMQEDTVEPRDEKEKIIFDIISELVGSINFGVTSDLFTIGLTSLMAIKVAVLLKNKLGISIATSEIIKRRTIENIAGISEKEQVSPIEAVRLEKRDYYPLTQNQLGVYYDCAKQPWTLKYNIPTSFTVSPEIDAYKLAKAFAAVINAHPYLKTNLAMRGQTLQQLRQDEREVAIPVYNVSEDELQIVKNNFVKPFDLFAGPLFRTEVYQTPQRVCLLTDFHHLILDGGSLDILFHELARAYNGESISKDTFTAYELALKEEELPGSNIYRKAKDYFSQKLKDYDGATMIPSNRNEDEASGKLQEQIAIIAKEKIRDFCKKTGVTPSSFFLAGVSYVTSRFSGSKNLLLSTLDNGRGEAEKANVLGMLVKTLPLAITVDSSLPVSDFVKQTQRSIFETMENGSYPLTRIAEEYHFSPQINYAYQSGVINEYTIGEHPVKLESLEQKSPKFKLSVHIEEKDQHYRVCVQYNDALYSATLIQTLADSVTIALERMMADQSGLIGEVSILSKEHRLAIDRFNETYEPNGVSILHSLFEEQVRQKGEKTALIARDGDYTYFRLNSDANRIANALIKKGLAVEDRVAFMLPRDGRLITTMLGILKAGGAYIPIDPEYPPERIKYILEDSSAKYIICCREKSVECDAQQLFVDSLLAEENEVNPQVDVKPENLSYIIYTSGSTGKPKGVMLEHMGISNYVAPTARNIHVRALVDSASAMVSVTTVSFDMFLKESFTMLMNGLTLILASEDQANNPMQLAELFKTTGADAFNATPSRMLQYLELPAFREVLGQCKVVMAGGEAYPYTLFEKLKSITKARLFNTYGPTEITVSSNAKELKEAVISVGMPLANVKEFIVDTDGNLLPIGITGELWIGGEGVGRGYWRRADLTAQSFIEIPEGRVYKTGDLARWNRNGDVIILGRNDNQVKLRGLRIELGEIQTAVCQHPGISMAVVVIRKIKGAEHICTYYTAGTQVSPEKIRDNLKKTLAKYMVPTAYKQLERLPVSPNGKTDLNALPEPDLMAKQDYVAPTNDIEKSFCEIFAQVLNIANPGIEDDFFDLGGTSLLVTRVTIEAMNRGYNISYGDVFTHPTPKEMAILLSQNQNNLEQQPSQKEGESIGEYDYSAIEELLKQNTQQAFQNGEKQKLGNVLLTGATGFLGIHILKEFLENEDGMIYCFMRSGRQSSLEKRLKSMLVYYFENSYDDLFGIRIFPVEGDITNADDFNRLQSLPIDTVINCAANVKHFAHSQEIERINVGGVQNAIDFCKAKDCQLIQISTASVAGFSIDGNPSEDIQMDETMLYFSQNLDNKYIGSKFRAERLILQEAVNGLKAKIMRVGNLMARSRDGEFQINFHTNGFINRLRAYQAIGKVSYSILGSSTELAPIDSTAQAVLKLARAPKECCVFHPYNNHSIFIGDVIEVMKEKGMVIDAVEGCEFERYLSLAMRDKSKAEALAGLIAYLNMGRGKRVLPLSTSNDYTMQILYRYGFKWPLTTDGYLDKFISLLTGLGFFMEEREDV